MVIILLGVLHSANPHKILSVLPENPYLYFPTKFIPLKLGIHWRQRQAEARRDILGLPRLVLKNVYQFLQREACPSVLRMRRGIPRVCRTLIYRQPMARIVQPLRHVTWFVVPSTIVKKRLPTTPWLASASSVSLAFRDVKKSIIFVIDYN